MLRATLFPLGCAAALLTPVAAQQLVLAGNDPILLARGETKPGRADLEAMHEGWIYRFAEPANRETFRSDPARHAVQLGGACARMGPLSGLGEADLWASHDGRLYLFASPQCREGFLKAPAAFLDADDPKPEGDEAAKAAGSALLAKAVDAVGGAARLRALRSVQFGWQRDDRGTRLETRVAVQFPACWRIDTDYFQGDKAWRYHRVCADGTGFFVGGEPVRTMAVAAWREARREWLREPLFALYAAVAGKPLAVAGPSQTLDGKAVASLQLWQEGCATTFAIADNGEIVQASYRGRGPTLQFGQIVRSYASYREQAGIRMPLAVTGTFAGKPSPALAEHRDAVGVDVELPRRHFTRPE